MSFPIVERDSPYSFVSKFVVGTRLDGVGQVPDGYFEELNFILNQIHRRGVADIDFAHEADLLVTQDGHPVVIDLASAITYQPGNRIKPKITQLIFNYVCELNRKYLLRRKAQHLPDRMSPEEMDDASRIGLLATTWRTYRAIRRYIKYDFLGLPRSN